MGGGKVQNIGGGGAKGGGKLFAGYKLIEAQSVPNNYISHIEN